MFSPPKNDAKFMNPTPQTGGNSFSPTNSGSAQTIIARGVRVEGDFRSQGNVTIEGELVGSLTCGGHLTIGPEASIQASVVAEEATISGNVQGNVRVAKRLELKSTARVKGDITTEAIAVESGASLEGQFAVGGGVKAAPQPVANNKPKEVLINTPAEAQAEAKA